MIMKRVYNDTIALHAIDRSKEFIPKIQHERKDNKSEDDVLLNIIFAPDPRTGLPKGDLQAFLSKDASPEVKQYIQDKLMRPTGEKPKNTGLSIDDMDAFTRRPNESRDSYISRMTMWFDNYRAANQAINENKIEKL